MLPTTYSKQSIILMMWARTTNSSSILSCIFIQIFWVFVLICRSSDEVLHILGNILGSLQRGRTSLIVPRKKTMDELMKSRNMVCNFVNQIIKFKLTFLQKSLTPNLPEDLAISFYIQSHKLIFAIYQLVHSHGEMKYESTHAECSVPWLNEVLVLFTVGLQLCQQLKDKVSVFTLWYVFFFLKSNS